MHIQPAKKPPFFLQLQRIGNAGEERSGELRIRERDSVAEEKRKRNLYFLLQCAKEEGESPSFVL